MSVGREWGQSFPWGQRPLQPQLPRPPGPEQCPLTRLAPCLPLLPEPGKLGEWVLLKGASGLQPRLHHRQLLSSGAGLPALHLWIRGPEVKYNPKAVGGSCTVKTPKGELPLTHKTPRTSSSGTVLSPATQAAVLRELKRRSLIVLWSILTLFHLSWRCRGGVMPYYK